MNMFEKELKRLCVNCDHKSDSLDNCADMLEHFKKTRECPRYKCCIPSNELNMSVQTSKFIAKFLNMKNDNV